MAWRPARGIKHQQVTRPAGSPSIAYRVTPNNCILRRKVAQSRDDPEECMPSLGNGGGGDIRDDDPDREEAAGPISREMADSIGCSAALGWTKDGERAASRAVPTLGSRGAGLGPDTAFASDPTAIERSFSDSIGSRPGGTDDVSSEFLVMADFSSAVAGDPPLGFEVEPDCHWADLSRRPSSLGVPGSGTAVGKGNGGGTVEGDGVEDANWLGAIAEELVGLCLTAALLSAPG